MRLAKRNLLKRFDELQEACQALVMFGHDTCASWLVSLFEYKTEILCVFFHFQENSQGEEPSVASKLSL